MMVKLKKKEFIQSDLVRYSRAGDVFHYRWAARRCLKMIHPKSPLSCVVIEGSKDREKAGEYTIDVTEYSDSVEGNSKKVSYFQLKHTTVRKEQPFHLSDLKETIKGFAERFSVHLTGENKSTETTLVTFSRRENNPLSTGAA